MVKYLQAFVNGIGSTVLQITSAADLPRYQRHGFRRDAAKMRKSVCVVTKSLKQRVQEIKGGK